MTEEPAGDAATGATSVVVKALTEMDEPRVGIGLRNGAATEWALVKPSDARTLAFDIDSAAAKANNENSRRRALEDRRRPCRHVDRARKVDVDEYGITTWVCDNCEAIWRNGGALDEHIQISRIDQAVCIACGEVNLDGESGLEAWAIRHPDGRGGLCTPESRRRAPA
ncbi:MAG: hypothetical protein F4Z31_01520 [Gemmatimonadetes bacterium]|nr:hypothetical protein [Gemmatimonadota bacterium]